MTTTSDLSIGTLAARTGLTAGTLRMWENRFGFPRGTRTPSGHRRFDESDVELVAQVIEARDAGMSLGAAIDAVRDQHRQRDQSSVYAELTSGKTALPHRRFDRRTLIALSHAIEDETLARAERSIVLGAFQHGYRFANASARWGELARCSDWCAVVADFDLAETTETTEFTGPNAQPGQHAAAVQGGPRDAPVRVSLPADSPMRREWSVICISSRFSAVLSAWEVPGPPEVPATYEAVFSTSRTAAIAAARVLAGVVSEAGHQPPERVTELLAEQRPETGVIAHEVDRLYLRALSALAHMGR